MSLGRVRQLCKHFHLLVFAYPLPAKYCHSSALPVWGGTTRSGGAALCQTSTCGSGGQHRFANVTEAGSLRRRLNGRKEEADDGLDVKEAHQLDALQPVSFVANSNISSSSSNKGSIPHAWFATACSVALPSTSEECFRSKGGHMLRAGH